DVPRRIGPAPSVSSEEIRKGVRGPLSVPPTERHALETRQEAVGAALRAHDGGPTNRPERADERLSVEGPPGDSERAVHAPDLVAATPGSFVVLRFSEPAAPSQLIAPPLAMVVTALDKTPPLFTDPPGPETSRRCSFISASSTALAIRPRRAIRYTVSYELDDEGTISRENA